MKRILGISLLASTLLLANSPEPQGGLFDRTFDISNPYFETKLGVNAVYSSLNDSDFAILSGDTFAVRDQVFDLAFAPSITIIPKTIWLPNITYTTFSQSMNYQSQNTFIFNGADFNDVTSQPNEVNIEYENTLLKIETKKIGYGQFAASAAYSQINSKLSTSITNPALNLGAGLTASDVVEEDYKTGSLSLHFYLDDTKNKVLSYTYEQELSGTAYKTQNWGASMLFWDNVVLDLNIFQKEYEMGTKSLNEEGLTFGLSYKF